VQPILSKAERALSHDDRERPYELTQEEASAPMVPHSNVIAETRPTAAPLATRILIHW